MVRLPMFGFLISFISNIDPSFKVGLVLIAICPGGATANLVIFMLMGNMALAVSLTIINSLLSLFTIPFLARLGLIAFMEQDTIIHLPYMETLVNLFIIVIIPAFIGILIRHHHQKFAEGLERPLRYILPLMLLCVYLGVIFIEKSDKSAGILDYFNIFYLSLILNAVSMVAGYGLSRMVKLSNKNSYTIAVQTGLQNSTLAIFISVILLNNKTMAVPPIVYGSFTFFSTWFIGYLMKIYCGKRGKKKNK